MAQTTNTLEALYNRCAGHFKTTFGYASNEVLKVWLNGFAAALAGVSKLIYLYIAEVNNNVWPDTCDEATLLRFGRLKLLRDPFPATYGEYNIAVTGTNGASVALGTQFKTIGTQKDSVSTYVAITSATIVGGTATVRILALEAGKNSELTTNDNVYTVNPVAGVNTEATVTSTEVYATDAETTAEYRDKVLQVFRLEPSGGSNADYVKWSFDAAGVRTVYPYVTPGQAGMLVVYAEATGTNPVPTQPVLDSLWKSDKTGVFELSPDTTQSIYERGRRPVTLVDITILPVVSKSVTVEIRNLRETNASVSASVEDKLKATLLNIRPYVAGVGDPTRPNDTLRYSTIITALDAALGSGNTYDEVTVKVDGAQIPRKFTMGDIPVLTTVSYV